MKKKLLFVSAMLLVANTLFAQVGINTENPQGIFNIDGGKDNPTTGTGHTPAQQLNDFTVLASGNVGIGTTAPTQKLEIQTGGTATTPVTGFKLTDGNEATGYVLTTDATGVATWKPGGITMASGSFTANTNDMPFYQTTTGGIDWIQTGGSITLNPGVWKVDLIELLRGDALNSYELPVGAWCWIRFTLADTNTATTPSADFVRLQSNGSLIPDPNNVQLVSTGYQGLQSAGESRFAYAQGTFLVRNNGTVPKTYYVVTQNYRSYGANPSVTSEFRFRRVGSNTWGENQITAIQLSQY